MKESDRFCKGVNVVIGGQWGDEAKGKVVDALAQDVDVVARWSGGNNAGHTVVNEKGKFALHLVPSGIFNPDVVNLVLTGTVVNSTSLPKEIEDLRQRGIEISSTNLRISKEAHLVMPWHIKRDNLSERARGKEKIGTTGQGIGPTYSDRSAREGFRVVDLLNPNFQDEFDREFRFQERLTRTMDNEPLASELKGKSMDEIEEFISQTSERKYYDRDSLWEELKKAREVLGPMIVNTLGLLEEYHKQGKRILGEGAQGVLLGLDVGTFPFVTSSDPTVYGFVRGTGIPYGDIRNIIGVFKAYSTRVGGGPMPTEQENDIGDYIRRRGNEVGTTTGRDRRIGWFDAPLARYAVKHGGINGVALTKIDVLDELEEIKIGVTYEVGNTLYMNLTEVSDDFMRSAKVNYETLPGWKEDTTKARNFGELPKNAQKFIYRIQELIGLPIGIMSVGPEREAIIYR